MNTQTLEVTGMTCGHCVDAVTSELQEVPGVVEVTVDLVPEGRSSVTVVSSGPVEGQSLAAALDEAGGYELVSG